MGAVTFSLDPRLLECLRACLPLTTFVETGTFKGDAVALVAPHVERVVTIEYSEPLWKEAVARFEGTANVELLLGDSPEVLARICPALRDTPTLFWLDAHWCVADNTAGDHSQCPLLEEIAAIGPLGPSSVILIDDARLFLAPPPEPHDVTHWPSLDQILAALRGLSERHEVMVVNDVIAFYPREIERAVEAHARKHGVDWLRARQSLEENSKLRAAIEEKEAALVALTRSLEEKEALIHSLHESAAAAHGRETELTGQLVAKEAVIQEMSRALNAYRAVFPGLQYFIRPLRPVVAAARFVTRGTLRAFGPRLGNLNQHAPRPLRLPEHYASAVPPAAAPRFSIVTPSFGQAQFIERTIQSVLGQSYPNLEYRVQDGGSKDGTVGILERYASRLAGWESRPDSGQSEAINRAFAATTGEIMAWINSDDLLLPGALACVADYFVRHPEVDVVYGHRILIDENDDEIGRWMMPAHDDEVLSWADYVPQETLFWRRRIWDKAGGRVDESFRFAMDWDLLVRFRDAGARFARLPRFLGGFRIHPHQKTSAAISDIGFKEMDRIRSRALGRVPRPLEIRKAVLPYLLKHAAVDLGWRIRRKLGAA